MTSGVTIPELERNGGTCPTPAPTAVTPQNWDTPEIVPPHVPPSNSTGGATIGDWLDNSFAPDGTDGRLVQLLRLLDSDPSLDLHVINGQVRIPGHALKLRQLAIRCGVSSPSSAGEWLRQWRSKGYLIGTIVDLRTFTRGTTQDDSIPAEPSADADVLPTSSIDNTQPAMLDVVLTHLGTAVSSGQREFVDILVPFADRLISEGLRSEPPRGRRAVQSELRGARSEPSPRVTERSEVVSSFLLQEKDLTTYQLRAAVPTARQPDSPRGAQHTDQPNIRTEDQLTQLLAPLHETAKRYSLSPLTSWTGLEAALRPFTDRQVDHAQRVILRQIKQPGGEPIRSPFGLLISHAQKSSASYFNPPDHSEEPTTRSQPPENTPNGVPDQSAVDVKATIRSIKDQLGPKPSRT